VDAYPGIGHGNGHPVLAGPRVETSDGPLALDGLEGVENQFRTTWRTRGTSVRMAGMSGP
jgi:hypothetical protein